MNRFVKVILSLFISFGVFWAVAFIVNEITYVIDPTVCPRFKEAIYECNQAGYRGNLGVLIGLIASIIVYKKLKKFR